MIRRAWHHCHGVTSRSSMAMMPSPSSHVHDPAGLASLPWSDVEELVAVHKTDARVESPNYLRSVMMVVAVLSFALPLIRGSLVLLGGPGEDKVRTHMV